MTIQVTIVVMKLSTVCSTGKMKCENRRTYSCEDKQRRCNVVYDCDGPSDEKNCTGQYKHDDEVEVDDDDDDDDGGSVAGDDDDYFMSMWFNKNYETFVSVINQMIMIMLPH